MLTKFQKETDLQLRVEMQADLIKEEVIESDYEIYSAIQNEIIERALEDVKQKYLVVSPTGDEFEIESIYGFCRDTFGCEGGRPRYVSSFSDLLNGKRKSPNVHGWKIKFI